MKRKKLKRRNRKRVAGKSMRWKRSGEKGTEKGRRKKREVEWEQSNENPPHISSTINIC